MLYYLLVGLMFVGSYCQTQISVDTLADRIEVLEKKLEHGGRKFQGLKDLDSKSHWLSFRHAPSSISSVPDWIYENRPYHS